MKKSLFCLALLLCALGSFAKDYNRVGFSYNYQSIKFNNYYWDKINEMPTNGFGFGYTHGFNILRHAPLYLEAGLAFDFGWGTKTEGYKFLYKRNPDVYREFKRRYRQSDMRIPVNLSYKFNLGKNWSLSPSAGVNFIVNLSQDSKECVFENGKQAEYGETQWIPLMDETYTPDPWKTAEFRWQAGLNVTYRHIFVTAEFSRGFSRIVNEPNTKYYDVVYYQEMQNIVYPKESMSASSKKCDMLSAMRNSIYITLGYSF